MIDLLRILKMIQLYPEVWLAIFNALDNAVGKKTDLRSICQTSRTFCELSEPLLFANISLQTDYLPHPSTPKLISVLRSRAETRQWVKSIFIDTRPSSGEAESIIQNIANIFVELLNLRRIRIYHMTLTDDMVHHLYRLRHPFSFNCWNVSCSTQLARFELDPQNLQIIELVIEELRAPHIAAVITRLALGPHLSILQLSRSAALHAYRIPLRNSNFCLESLRYLEVSYPRDRVDREGFVDFLAFCPGMVDPKIYPRPNTVAEEPFTLPHTSLPLLSTFNGPYELAGLFVAGRPLNKLALVCPKRQTLSKGSLSRLAQGVAPLKELEMGELVWYDGLLLDVAEYLPALQTLKLWVASKEYLVCRSFCSSMSFQKANGSFLNQ